MFKVLEFFDYSLFNSLFEFDIYKDNYDDTYYMDISILRYITTIEINRKTK